MVYFAVHPSQAAAAESLLAFHACEVAGNWDLEDYLPHTQEPAVHVSWIHACNNRIKFI
jgi:hypothetical protein